MRRKHVLILTGSIGSGPTSTATTLHGRLTVTLEPDITTSDEGRAMVTHIINALSSAGIHAEPKLPEPHR